MADRLHQPLERVMEETSSTQFLKWTEHWKRKVNEKRREFYYMAALRYEIYLLRMSMTANPEDGQVRIDQTIEDFMLSWDTDGGRMPQTEQEWEEYDQKNEENLLAWLGIGIGEDGRPKNVPPHVSVKMPGDKDKEVKAAPTSKMESSGTPSFREPVPEFSEQDVVQLWPPPRVAAQEKIRRSAKIIRPEGPKEPPKKNPRIPPRG